MAVQRAADLLGSAVAKFEAALARGDRSGGRAAGLALAKLAAAAPAGDPSLQATLEVGFGMAFVVSDSCVGSYEAAAACWPAAFCRPFFRWHP